MSVALYAKVNDTLPKEIYDVFDQHKEYSSFTQTTFNKLEATHVPYVLKRMENNKQAGSR